MESEKKMRALKMSLKSLCVGKKYNQKEFVRL